MKRLFDTIICDIEKMHELFLLEYRSIEKFVNFEQFHKKTTAKITSWNWHLRLDHCRSKMINQFKKIENIEMNENDISKIVQCDIWAISKIHCIVQRASSAETT